MEAALPRPTLAYPGTAKCFLMGLRDGILKCSGAPPSLGAAYPGTQSAFFEMLRGASKQWSFDGGSLAKTYPYLPWHRKLFSFRLRN